jgi:hypothetical protein
MNPRTPNPRFPCRPPQKNLPGYLLYFTMVLVIVCGTPWLSRNLPPMIIAGIPALVIGGFFLHRLPCPRSFPGTLGIVLGYVFLTLGYKYLGISSAELGYYFSEFKFLFVMLVMACLGPFLSRKHRLWLCVLAIGVLVVNMVDNIRLWKMLGSRYVLFFQREGGTSNVADTPFATAVMLGMGALFLLALYARRRYLKWMAWSLVPFFAYFLIFVVQRGITFFLGLAMLSFLALPASVFRVDTTKNLALWSFSIFALLVLFVGGGAEVILSGLASLLEDSPRIHSRITHMLMLFQTNSLEETGGSLAGRIELIKMSIDTFLQSPGSILFGIGNHRTSDLFGPSIGNHSLFFDTFARYGLLGGCLFVWSLRRISLTLSETAGIPRSHPLRPKLMVFYVVYIVRAILGNPSHDSVATQLFVTVPLLISLLAASERGPARLPENFSRNNLHERSGTC